MPELPEVETVRRGLLNLVVGKQIKLAEYNWPKSFPNSQSDVDAYLKAASIIDIKRRAKVILIELNTGYTLVIHLKMTGQLVYKGEQDFGAGHPNDSLVGKLPDRSTRVIISFMDGTKLFFNDQRKFGWMRLISSNQVMELPFFRKIGPEPLEESFTQNVFIDRLQKRPNATVKSVLLDQTVLAGVGNIYADESLWGAKIHPSIRIKNISKAKLGTLHNKLIKVLKLSIEKGGSTDRNYVNAEGKKGSYIDFAMVFRREGLPCLRCKTMIEKSRVAGRGTHTCPKCQKPPMDTK